LDFGRHTRRLLAGNAGDQETGAALARNNGRAGVSSFAEECGRIDAEARLLPERPVTGVTASREDGLHAAQVVYPVRSNRPGFGESQSQHYRPSDNRSHPRTSPVVASGVDTFRGRPWAGGKTRPAKRSIGFIVTILAANAPGNSWLLTTNTATTN